ncbi:hypothetical protein METBISCDRAFT_19313 [Metschnikowia bicuspidata]|uniref:Amino acid permease/ SLC12A domain-containing protein n=1 Tax=Metschnikowia bicuspidata TaxID=27322 RepID=A0A4P9Z8Y3_9ASCO|nr:hypothetical protein METBISCDRAFT_19313 [Metschnikowia bicuspidata]
MSGTEMSAGLEKSADDVYVTDPTILEDLPSDGKHKIKRNLQARHISMIALGGTIGTGLFFSTKGPVSNGPGLAIIAYLFITTLAYSVTQSLGEMATYLPVSGSFTQFATRFCSPALGVANGWNYWFSWAITFAMEVTVVGQILQFWTDAVPIAAWISIFWVLTTIINMFPVRFYGEFEFWIAGIKVIAVMGWLIYALCMVSGVSKEGPIGFRYWRNPGAWGDGHGPWSDSTSNIHTRRFLSWVSSLVSALFTFQGVELVGVSCGESANPRKNVPSAIRKVIWRIVFFYVLAVFFMGLLIPYNDPALNATDTLANSSPFIIAIRNCGTPVLPDIFNAIIFLAIVSAGNSNVYSASRVLYGLAQVGSAPKIFLTTNKAGVPYVAVLTTASFGALGYLVVSKGGQTVFDWLLNITAVAGLMAWVNISFSHIRFMRVLKYHNMSRDDLPFKAAAMPYQAYYSFVLSFVLVFVQGFAAFYSITATKFFTSYISVILFFAVWFVAHIYYNGFGRKAWVRNAWLRPLEDVDIFTGARDSDNEQWEDEEKPKSFFRKFLRIIS